MRINFNNSFTVVFLISFGELQNKMVLDLPPHLKHVDDYLEKFVCSTARLFIISQNIVHIRLVKTMNWEVFLNRFIFSLLSIFERC